MSGLRMFTIKEHLQETPSIMTIRFKESLDALPGQFVMVWVPGVDEFPMSASYCGRHFGITYKIIGGGTKALTMKRVGEKIGIRGPYGNSFTVNSKRLLFVAGGAGAAPIGLLAEYAVGKKASVDLVLGARTSKEILFERRCANAGAKVHVSTDDGTKGFKGLATVLAREVLAKEDFDAVYACGPEMMIVDLLELTRPRRIPLQASLERLMKCGIGICDSCAIDGMHVCTDGPVFSDTVLRKFEDLGKTKLDAAGRRTSI